MSNKNGATHKKSKNGLSKSNVVIIAAAIILAVIALLVVNGNNKADEASAGNGTDIVINKSEITETVKFYPTKVGKTNMEVLAVKASDGTIRTAFNTCQVCNGSPRAYYKQEGDILVCQNCGNQFSMDMIEQERGGCNPIPILKGDKTEDENSITISGDFIAQNKGLFTENWKSQ